jgi:nitroreductase
MELLKAIYQRRAIRQFSDAETMAGVVTELLRAAVQAPSACNEQPWSFAVFQGRERLVEYSRRAKEHLMSLTDASFGLDPRIDRYANPNINIFHGADTVIVICVRPCRHASTEDCFLAAQNLMLAAHGFGLGSCPVGFARPWFNLPEVKTELGIPGACTAVLPIAIGHAAGPVPAVARNEAEIVSWVSD